MKRTYCESLSRKQLKDWGFTQIVYQPNLGIKNDDPKKDWYIERLWKKNSSKQPVLKRINVTEAVCKHKYSADKKYWKVTFMTDEGPKSITLARLIYVWFIGDLEAREVVDHIDNNPFNNYPNNLQKLSVGENLAKRYIDNPFNSKNQYETKVYKLIKENPEVRAIIEEKLSARYN